MTRQQRRKITRELEKNLGRKFVPRTLPNDLNNLTKEQIVRMDNTVVMDGNYTTNSGNTFSYLVTEIDILRREITGKGDFMSLIRGGIITPLEISDLLSKTYGQFPQNLLKEVYFNFN